jgi:hypothetical protein
MGKINLGHVDYIEAYEFRDVLWLLGRGTNPTLGWKSWFQPVKIRPGVFEFLQETPDGATIGSLTPFKVLNAFQSRDEQEVAVRKLVGGKPVIEMISVRKASPVPADAFSQLWPPNAPEEVPPAPSASSRRARSNRQGIGPWLLSSIGSAG